MELAARKHLLGQLCSKAITAPWLTGTYASSRWDSVLQRWSNLLQMLQSSKWAIQWPFSRFQWNRSYHKSDGLAGLSCDCSRFGSSVTIISSIPSPSKSAKKYILVVWFEQDYFNLVLLMYFLAWLLRALCPITQDKNFSLYLNNSNITAHINR